MSSPDRSCVRRLGASLSKVVSNICGNQKSDSETATGFDNDAFDQKSENSQIDLRDLTTEVHVHQPRKLNPTEHHHRGNTKTTAGRTELKKRHTWPGIGKTESNSRVKRHTHQEQSGQSSNRQHTENNQTFSVKPELRDASSEERNDSKRQELSEVERKLKDAQTAIGITNKETGGLEGDDTTRKERNEQAASREQNDRGRDEQKPDEDQTFRKILFKHTGSFKHVLTESNSPSLFAVEPGKPKYDQGESGWKHKKQEQKKTYENWHEKTHHPLAKKKDQGDASAEAELNKTTKDFKTDKKYRQKRDNELSKLKKDGTDEMEELIIAGVHRGKKEMEESLKEKEKAENQKLQRIQKERRQEELRQLSKNWQEINKVVSEQSEKDDLAIEELMTKQKEERLKLYEKTVFIQQERGNFKKMLEQENEKTMERQREKLGEEKSERIREFEREQSIIYKPLPALPETAQETEDENSSMSGDLSSDDETYASIPENEQLSEVTQKSEETETVIERSVGDDSRADILNLSHSTGEKPMEDENNKEKQSLATHADGKGNHKMTERREDTVPDLNQSNYVGFEQYQSSLEFSPLLVYKFSCPPSFPSIVESLKKKIPKMKKATSKSNCTEFYADEKRNIRVGIFINKDELLILRANVHRGPPTTFFNNIRIWVEESILDVYQDSGPSIFLHISPCPVSSDPDWFENVCIDDEPIGTLSDLQERPPESEAKLPFVNCTEHGRFLMTGLYQHWFGFEPIGASMPEDNSSQKLLMRIARKVDSKQTIEALGTALGLQGYIITRCINESPTDFVYAASKVLQDWYKMHSGHPNAKQNLLNALREANFDSGFIAEMV